MTEINVNVSKETTSKKVQKKQITEEDKTYTKTSDFRGGNTDDSDIIYTLLYELIFFFQASLYVYKVNKKYTCMNTNTRGRTTFEYDIIYKNVWNEAKAGFEHAHK